VPYPTCVGSKTVCVRTARGKLPVVEHMALDRSADCMNTLADVSYSTMEVSTMSMSRNIAARWWASVAVPVGARLSLEAATSEYRRKSDARER